MVAALGDVTAGPALPSMREHMLASAEGRRILRDRPRINSSTVDLSALAQLPPGTFGRAYSDWLQRCNVTPDTRDPVRYIQDPELAYVMQRYRESHDFYHALCGMPVSVEYELALKYFEFANNGLPMAALGAVFGPLRLNGEKRARLFNEYVPWALRCGGSAKPLITVYWEERWQQNLEDLKAELGVWDPPPPKWRKQKAAAQPSQEPLAPLHESATLTSVHESTPHT